MSPVSLTLDLLLASLLLITLVFGLRLDKRLKTLNATQAEFQAAIVDLDRAGARAEAGLADLRAAMDEAVELLGGRLEKARELAQKLEMLTAAAANAARAVEQTPPLARAVAQDQARGRPAVRPGGHLREVEPLTLTRRDTLVAARPAAPQPVRSQGFEDELFDGPLERRRAGGRL
ncbi:MAG TPA: DUF6468 domain-containing protein [Caulobacteraceae bacterium]|nr:DUF6468 domain-containing protein [Caulobacteraceae bacterium]